jgi:cyclic beta-1,2-glucan synthetase
MFEMDPCLPSAWTECSISWRIGATRYEITVSNPDRRCRGVAEALLDGIGVDPHAIPIVEDGATHAVTIVLGDRGQSKASSAIHTLEGAASR